MQELYRITVTDRTYAYEGSDEYFVTDKEVFDRFNKAYTENDLELPEKYQDDGYYSLLDAAATEAVEYPYVCLGETHMWSNC